MNSKLYSLYSLSKVSPSDNSVVEIHTINLYSQQITDPDIVAYFHSRRKFLELAYDFAKDWKITSDQNFEDSKQTQDEMRKWLVGRGKGEEAYMINGAEFGVITTKVVESLKSIAGNQFLDNLQISIKDYIYLEVESQPANPKSIKPPRGLSAEELKEFKKEQQEAVQQWQRKYSQFNVRQEHLADHITTGLIKKHFKYDLFEQVNNWVKICESINQSEKLGSLLRAKTQTIKTNCRLFLQEAEALLEMVLSQSKNYIVQKQISDKFTLRQVLPAFVNRFFFEFDPKVRELEGRYLTDLNEEINSFMQLLAKEVLILSGSDLEQEAGEVKKLTFKMQKLDYVDDQVSSRFVQLLEWVLVKDWDMISSKSGKKVHSEDKKFKTENWFKSDSLFLRHPKSAPSFPSLSDRIIAWNSSLRTSQILSEHINNFGKGIFADKLDQRCQRIVASSQVYRIYQHLHGNQESSLNPEAWLQLYRAAAKLPSYPWRQKAIKIDLLKKSPTAKNSGKLRYIVRFVFIGTTGKIDNRLNEMQFKLDVTADQTPELDYITGEVNRYLEEWIDREFVNLIKDNPEIRLYAQNEFEPEQLSKYLQKLEQHLLLDQDHQDIRIFDKVSFKRYQNLSQLVFESISGQETDAGKKLVREKKASLAKLLANKPLSVPLKISRVTSDKPNAKSSLLFELDRDSLQLKTVKQGKKSYLQPYAAFYPVNLCRLNGENYTIKETLDEVLKEIGKKNTKYEKVMVGFLNGSQDNHADKIPHTVAKTDGTEGRYTTYENWKLYESQDIVYFDTDRGNRETVGATAPAGYPRLFYFLIPKVCNNLIVPVATNFYYLHKYTPYHCLQEYLRLNRAIYDFSRQGIDPSNPEVKAKALEVLRLRAKLRYQSRISSLELDLVQNYTLDHKNQQIISKIMAEVHLQFGNPVKINPDREYTYQQAKSRFETILSIDLGEKILATATLTRVNWETERLKTEDRLLRTFLPLSEINQKDNEGNIVTNSHFYQAFEPIKFKAPDKNYLEFDSRLDSALFKFRSILRAYRSQQRKYGTVKNELKQRKDNLTDQLIEKISTQIAKLAYHHKSLVVFEDLSNAFGSKKYELSLYTEIYRQTVRKLQKLGLATSLEYEKLVKLKPSDFRFGVANVRAYMTSKTCSNCNFVPSIYKEPENGKGFRPGIVINDQWQESGQIGFWWKASQEQNNSKPFLTIRHKEENKQDIVFDTTVKTQHIFNEEHGLQTLSQFLECKDYGYKDNTTFKTVNMMSNLANRLISDKTKKQLKLTDDTKKFILKQVLDPRHSQADYFCPCCGHTDNADYQASFNIGNKFFRAIQEDNLK